MTFRETLGKYVRRIGIAGVIISAVSALELGCRSSGESLKFEIAQELANENPGLKIDANKFQERSRYESKLAVCCWASVAGSYGLMCLGNYIKKPREKKRTPITF